MTPLARAGDGFRRMNVVQGETRVSDEPDVMLTTVLGSCIAACLHDPVAKIGGLNHFLLAEPGDGDTDLKSMQRYGVYAMEVLINAMLAMGGTRGRLKARIYGGAAMRAGFRDIGATNAIFARQFLKDEGIQLVGEDVGGFDARRVDFRPTVGLARCRIAADRPSAERATLVVPRPKAAPVGDVELF